MKIQYTQTHKEKVRLTSGVAYHFSESFALWDGNIVYNHPLFLKEHRPICSKLRKKKKHKKERSSSFYCSIGIEIEFKIKIPISHGK